MSVSSNSRKESTESNAAQQMHNTMGIHPALGQLNDQTLVNDLPSNVADSNDTDVPGDVVEAEAEAAVGDDEGAVADTDASVSDESVPATRANEPVRTLGNA
ncbi:hypothetical protein [Spirosoma luteum]|uniref:hypothetical protein n=1 Tax=Spirosoma luteum TaxID=431553 RepID=UPI0003774867|nr:hypothetical protein [Spirosoma luteum]